MILVPVALALAMDAAPALPGRLLAQAPEPPPPPPPMVQIPPLPQAIPSACPPCPAYDASEQRRMSLRSELRLYDDELDKVSYLAPVAKLLLSGLELVLTYTLATAILGDQSPFFTLLLVIGGAIG